MHRFPKFPVLSCTLFSWFEILSLFLLPSIHCVPDIGKETELDPTHTLLRECATTQGGKGIYVDLTSCPSLLAEFSSIPSNGPIVCCPTPSPLPSPVSNAGDNLPSTSTDGKTFQTATNPTRNAEISSDEDDKELPVPELPDPLIKEDAVINLDNLSEVDQLQ